MAEVKEENMDSFQRYMTLRPVRRAIGIAFVQAALGVGAATLAVIGLEHFAAAGLLAVATIVVGAALLFEGGVMAARFSTLISRMDKAPARLGVWMAVEFVAGVAGITLGILAILQFSAFVLIPVAAMALGVAQIVNSGLNARLNALQMTVYKSEGGNQKETRETVTPYAGIGGLMGLGALVLGLIALAGMNPLMLSLVAILSVAAAHMLSGAVSFRMLGAIYRRYAE